VFGLVAVCIEIGSLPSAAGEIFFNVNLHATVCHSPAKSPHQQWGENLRNSCCVRLRRETSRSKDRGCVADQPRRECYSESMEKSAAAAGSQHSRSPPTFAIYDRRKFLHCAGETKTI